MNESTLEMEREEMVFERVYDLTNGEYLFTKRDNFSEFLSNMPDETIEDLRIWVKEYRTKTDEKVNHLEALGRCFYCAASGYWSEKAKARAEKEVPSIRELHNDHLSDVAESRSDR